MPFLWMAIIPIYYLPFIIFSAKIKGIHKKRYNNENNIILKNTQLTWCVIFEL